MTDQELLALAARAHGNIHAMPGCGTLLDDDTGRRWNPLEDDGDALRLAVKIKRFPVLLNDKTGVITGYESKKNTFDPIIERFGDDPSAATRRAIVRAAAEIGKEMTG